LGRIVPPGGTSGRSMDEIADRCGAAGRLDAERYRHPRLGRGIDADDELVARTWIHIEGRLPNQTILSIINVTSSSYSLVSLSIFNSKSMPKRLARRGSAALASAGGQGVMEIALLVTRMLTPRCGVCARSSVVIAHAGTRLPRLKPDADLSAESRRLRGGHAAQHVPRLVAMRWARRRLVVRLAATGRPDGGCGSG